MDGWLDGGGGGKFPDIEAYLIINTNRWEMRVKEEKGVL